MPDEKTELTFDKIAEWPKGIKIIVAVFSCLLLVLIAFWFDFKDQHNKLDAVTNHEIILKKQLQDKISQIQILQAIKIQLSATSALFKNTLENLISQDDLTKFLSNISKMAENNQLSLEALKPLKTKSYTLYTEVPVRIIAHGDYNKLANFISNLANMNQVVTFNNLAIKKGKDQQSELEMNVIASVYNK